VDECCVTPLVPGLWIAASVTFDSRDMSAQVVLQAAYTNRFLAIDAAGSFEINKCTEIGYVMRGDVYLDLSPFAAIRAGAQVVKHCEAPADAMRLYGHVWSVQVTIPSLLMFDGAFELYDVEVAAVGKQIGTKPGRSSNMTWAASLEGGARVVDFDALGRALGAGGLPPALRSMNLDVFVKAEVDFTAGKLLALYLNVTAGIAIGDAGDGSPVFDLTIYVEVTLVPANSEPLVCAAEGSINLGPVQVKFFEAMLTLYPDPVAPGQPKVGRCNLKLNFFEHSVDWVQRLERNNP